MLWKKRILNGLSDFWCLLMYFMKISNSPVVLLATLRSGRFKQMVWVFIADVIDWCLFLTVFCKDGIIYGVHFFVLKLAQALGDGIGSYVLTLIIYASSLIVLSGFCWVIADLTLILGYLLSKKRKFLNLLSVAKRY